MKLASVQSDTVGAPKVLVLGAHGRFGMAAAQAFAAAGWHVLAQVRRAPDRALPAGTRTLQIGLENGQRLVAASAGTAAVVYAVNPPYTRWPELLLPTCRMGMDIAQRLGATFLMPGNVYNFGETMPSILREDTPQRPTTLKGRLRVELEDELARRAPDLRSVVLCAGDFFGAGTGNWFDLVIVKSIADGKLVYPGPLDVPHAWAYLPDLARAFVKLAQREVAESGLPAFGRVHFAGHTLTGAQLLAEIERAADGLGLSPAGLWRHGAMPWKIIRAAGLIVPTWREVARMSYLWRRPHALDGTLLEGAIGRIESTDIGVALREALVALGHGRTNLATA